MPVPAPVKIISPGKGTPPSKQAPPRLQRRLAFPKSPLKYHGLCGKRIQIRRLDKTQFLIWSDNIGAKRIQTNTNYIHYKSPLFFLVLFLSFSKIQTVPMSAKPQRIDDERHASTGKVPYDQTDKKGLRAVVQHQTAKANQKCFNRPGDK